METPPKQKSFSVPSFATHATRGIIRDQSSRRKMMSGTLIVAALMVMCGVTVLQEVLSPREHALRFIAYWLTCAWFTMATLLLALFDALMVRAEARARRRSLSNEIARGSSDTPEKDDGE